MRPLSIFEAHFNKNRPIIQTVMKIKSIEKKVLFGYSYLIKYEQGM